MKCNDHPVGVEVGGVDELSSFMAGPHSSKSSAGDEEQKILNAQAG